MKSIVLFSLAALAILPATACAADEEAPSFGGFKAGIEASYNRDSVRTDTGNIGATGSARRSGVGYRGFAGYDVDLGGFVLGAEAGIGGGGRTVRQTGTRGTYSVNPGLTYDVSARAGFVATPGLLLYLPYPSTSCVPPPSVSICK